MRPATSFAGALPKDDSLASRYSRQGDPKSVKPLPIKKCLRHDPLGSCGEGFGHDVRRWIQ